MHASGPLAMVLLAEFAASAALGGIFLFVSKGVNCGLRINLQRHSRASNFAAGLIVRQLVLD